MIADYVGYVDAIFEEVTAIADPSEVLIRVQDFYAFPTDAYTDETAEIVYQYWREGQDYVGVVAGDMESRWRRCTTSSWDPMAPTIQRRRA